jgi:deaminated glutathione amidase
VTAAAQELRGSQSTPRVLRAGLTQWHATRDVARNLAIACQMIGDCAAAGADFVLLPENGLMLGTNAEMRAAAIRLEGREAGELRAAAKAAGVPVILGGAKRVAGDGSPARNTAIVIGADGELAGGYDKIHLFDARVGGQSFEASSVERAGDQPTMLRLGDALIGLTICYDVRFPELYRQLALAGAQVLLVPSAFTRVTGQAHWETLLRARAIENAAYVVASATVGNDPSDAFPTYGHALVVDPWGEILADLGDDELACAVVDLKLDTVTSTRERLPVLRGVRPAAYATPPVTLDVHSGARERSR